MILGSSKEQVAKNIRDAAENRDFYRKVEVDDPNLTEEECSALLQKYVKRQHSLLNFIYHFGARIVTWTWTMGINRHTKIEGLENISGLKGGAVITSNHFNPMDNTVVRKGIYKAFHQRIHIVSQDTNLAMKGFFGFLMNYADIIPISSNRQYMNKYFKPAIKKKLDRGKKILIYPEQEMWFNYRKPRPPKRGAYYYAAINSAKIISCFVEIKTIPELDNDEFYKTEYVLHILPTIYPDPAKSARENSFEMMQTDYKQKKEAYEKAYGHPLTYDYEKGDIAGLVSDEKEEYSKK